MTSEIVAQFAELFVGNQYAYGTDAGGCVREPPNWMAHLDGTIPQGVYPLRLCGENGEYEWKCKWLCIDLDIKSDTKPSGTYKDEAECHLAATNLQRVASKLGLTVWIERTRSNARHCWCFFKEWTSARTARHVGLVLCKVSGATDKEIFPKQETLADGQLGNYCRLPYPGPWRTVNVGEILRTQVILERDDDSLHAWPLTPEQFVRAALAERASTADLERVAALYKPPVKHTFIPQHTPYYGNPQLNALGRHAIEYGPANGDRSSSMAYISYQAHCSGLAPRDTFELLRNIPWNKYSGRKDEDQRLMELVERVYTQNG